MQEMIEPGHANVLFPSFHVLHQVQLYLQTPVMTVRLNNNFHAGTPDNLSVFLHHLF
jgi:hypothetical protein